MAPEGNLILSAGGVLYQSNHVALLSDELAYAEDLSIALVQHQRSDLEDDRTPETWWGLPKGMVEPGDTLSGRAFLEVVCETLRVPRRVADLATLVEFSYMYDGQPYLKRVHYSLMEDLGEAYGVMRDPEIIDSEFVPVNKVEEKLEYPINDAPVVNEAITVYERLRSESPNALRQI